MDPCATSDDRERACQMLAPGEKQNRRGAERVSRLRSKSTISLPA